MAIFSYKCEACGVFKKVLPTRSHAVECPKCGKSAKNVVGVGTVSVKERLDNGLMGRAIERLHNIDELMQEHSAINDAPAPENDDDETPND